MKLLTIFNKRTAYEYQVIAKDARRAKMLICIKNDKIKIPELKVTRSINLDGKTERVLDEMP